MYKLSLETPPVKGDTSEKIKTMFYEIFLKGFQFSCIGFTIYVYCLCIQKYLKQEDNSIVDFQWYHEHEKDIYPTISICFYGIPVVFSNEKLKQINNNFDANLYSMFLHGKYWDEEMIKVNYDDVTLNFLNHLESIRVVGTDGIQDKWAKNQLLLLNR